MMRMLICWQVVMVMRDRCGGTIYVVDVRIYFWTCAIDTLAQDTPFSLPNDAGLSSFLGRILAVHHTVHRASGPKEIWMIRVDISSLNSNQTFNISAGRSQSFSK